MNLTLPKRQLSQKRGPRSQTPSRQEKKALFPWLLTWDIYLVLLVAGFLRLYQINISEFNADQAAIFGLARDALQHGLLPIVSNRASIGIENPPAVIYLLMLPASLSVDPVWAAVMVALYNIFAVLLTYIFTRRYYGRFAALVAALLYATAAKPLNYSRFIWQQNMLAPFVIMFIFALFWGVVERRKGWFVLAVLLLGISYQLHETSLFLAIPLLAAIILAPGTVRWRDLAFALAILLVIFSPYILWEIFSRFSDVSIALNVGKSTASFDTESIRLYRLLLSPNGFTSYNRVPSNPASFLRFFALLLPWLRHLLQFIVFGGLATAAVLAVWPRRDTQSPAMTQRSFSFLIHWWREYRSTPYRCGLTLLLIWQVVPLLLLMHHTVMLYPYYLLCLMPGPYILAGFFLAQIAKWLQLIRQRGVSSAGAIARIRPILTGNALTTTLRFSIYAFAAFIVIAQLMTSTATVVDAAQGIDGYGKRFNDLNSLEKAMNEADILAQQRHLNRVYITTDYSTEAAMSYLTQQMRTPTTLFDDSRCFVLPNPTDGPAVMLVSPYADVTNALLREYASTTLVDQPARLGAPPFKLYIVSPLSTNQTTPAAETFVDHLQLVDLQKQQLALTNPSWLVSRWYLLRSGDPAPRITYTYAMTATTNNDSLPISSQCTFTAIRPGDQLFVAFSMPGSDVIATSVTLKGFSFTTSPYNPTIGPLHTETDQVRVAIQHVLRTASGEDNMTIPLSQ